MPGVGKSKDSSRAKTSKDVSSATASADEPAAEQLLQLRLLKKVKKLQETIRELQEKETAHKAAETKSMETELSEREAPTATQDYDELNELIEMRKKLIKERNWVEFHQVSEAIKSLQAERDAQKTSETRAAPHAAPSDEEQVKTARDLVGMGAPWNVKLNICDNLRQLDQYFESHPTAKVDDVKILTLTYLLSPKDPDVVKEIRCYTSGAREDNVPLSWAKLKNHLIEVYMSFEDCLESQLATYKAAKRPSGSDHELVSYMSKLREENANIDPSVAVIFLTFTSQKQRAAIEYTHKYWTQEGHEFNSKTDLLPRNLKELRTILRDMPAEPHTSQGHRERGRKEEPEAKFSQNVKPPSQRTKPEFGCFKCGDLTHHSHDHPRSSVPTESELAKGNEQYKLYTASKSAVPSSSSAQTGKANPQN